jgi:nicotinamidase-related amidase
MIQGPPALAVLMTGGEDFDALPSLIEGARAARIPVLWVLPAGFEAPAGWAPLAGEFTIRARRHSIFFGTDFSIVLKDLRARTLVLAGGVTSVTVHYSFVDAHQNDYFCRVAEDCMSGSSPAAHEAALCAMEYMQTGARRRAGELAAAFAAHHGSRSR